MTSISRALILAALALVLGGLGGYRYASMKGDAQVAKIQKAQVDQDKKDALALNAANEKYRKAEQDHATEVAKIRQEYQTNEQKALAVDASTIADLKSGAQRLRFQIAAYQAQSPETYPAGLGLDDPPTADLAPATAAALYSIAADGDTAIRRLTALQAWAKSAVLTCNGAP